MESPAEVLATIVEKSLPDSDLPISPAQEQDSRDQARREA